MVLDLFYQIRRMTVLKPFTIEGWVFRLHYLATTAGIFAAGAVAFAKQYFGDPIECIFDAKHGSKIHAVDAYCWLHSTVHLDSNLLQKLNTIPRVRTPCRGFPDIGSDSEDPMETHYYQWVPFFLLLQGLMFRIPWQLWRHLEGGKMAEFGLEAKRHLINIEEEEVLANQYAVAFHSVLHRNNIYFYQYVFCEILNMAVLLAVSALTDVFLSHQFWDFGNRIWEYQQMEPLQRSLTSNPMCSLFPTVTSCQFPSGAVTGNLNVDHAMCILSLNIINDKIFLMEWCWFLVLGTLTTLSLMGTTVFILFPSFRKYWIRRKARSWSEHDREVISSLLSRCYIGDCFVLYLLSKNTNAYIYKRIVKSIAVVLREQKFGKNLVRPASPAPVRRNGGNGGVSKSGSIGARYSMEHLELDKSGA